MSRKGPDSPPRTGIVLHRGLTLVQAEDRFVMAELQAENRLRTVMGPSLTDTAAVIPSAETDSLITLLRKCGHTPKVSGR